MDTTYRQELLTAALEGRIREVTEYQVNIDNYRDAIQRIGDDAELQDFKAYLKSLLESSILECRKAQLMLDVVTSQVNSAIN